MKIVNIRPGNWIIFKGSEKIDPKCVNDIVQVKGEDLETIYKIRIPMHGVTDEDFELGDVDLNIFQGIQITSDLLEKNEFVYCGEYYKKVVDNITIYYSLTRHELTIKEKFSRSGFKYTRRKLRVKDVYFIHQLQNYLNDVDLTYISRSITVL